MFIERLARAALRNATLRTALWPAVRIRRSWLSQRNSKAIEILDRLSDILAEDPVIRVDEFRGTFALSARSALFRRVIESGQYEPILTGKCIEYINPSRDVLDIGANIGFHTVLAAKLLNGGKVLSVEPTKKALARLRRNITMNGVDKVVTVFEGAVSSQTTTLDIKTIDGREEYSSVGVMDHPAIAGVNFVTERVKACTLDELVERNELDCGFIKLDVEGVEHTVFGGARNVLSNHRPIIISELSDQLLRKNGSSAREIVKFIESFNYVVTDPLNRVKNPWELEFGDILCIPR